MNGIRKFEKSGLLGCRNCNVSRAGGGAAAQIFMSWWPRGQQKGSRPCSGALGLAGGVLSGGRHGASAGIIG